MTFIGMRYLSRIVITSLVLLAAAPALADDSPKNGVDQAAYRQAVSKAIDYLRNKGAAEDGSYSSFAGIGPTALITTAMLRHRQPADAPHIARSLEYLKKFVQEDGGIYPPGSNYRNYETCLSVICFELANGKGEYRELLDHAEAFIKQEQWDAGENTDPSDTAYGGAGYGRHKRPDLSNTSFFMDALKAAGTDADDEAVQRALIFISRCQNLESEHNTTQFAAKVNDGGFYYTIAAGGSSMAGTTENGGLRSYGSMTYAGLKSMIYAGLGPEDPRVKAALAWIGKHYDLSENPGMGNAGLYYYYNTFAKALEAYGQDTFVDEAGQEHDWRAELAAAIIERQQPDGSWVNQNDRWLEGDPNLCTGYALLALSYCQPKSTPESTDK